MPENVQKLVDFMEETGGTLEDYVNLNKDYSELDNMVDWMGKTVAANQRQ